MLSLCPMYGPTKARDMRQQLCSATEQFGVAWNRQSTVQLFADPFSADERVPSMLQNELTDLRCNSELKTKFREAQGKADQTAKFLRAPFILARAVQSFQSCNAPFWNRVRNWSWQWTLIKASTVQGLLLRKHSRGLPMRWQCQQWSPTHWSLRPVSKMVAKQVISIFYM